tara:strand:- start:43 stop:582 length:540 start_codon:yes stop_codon:yes gene_type:complete
LAKIKIDISSIFPIIINIIKNNFVLSKRLAKLMLDSPYNEEFVVLVSVSIANLKEFSKLILSKTKTLERIKTLIKKVIKIKNERFIILLSIFFSEKKIVLLKTLFGLTSFIISADAVFINMYILINLIPDELEINEPPTAHKKIKNIVLFAFFVRLIPELLILLIIFIIISLKEMLFKE